MNEIKIPFNLIYDIVIILFNFYPIVLALKNCYGFVKLISSKHSIYRFLFKKLNNLKI